MKTHKEIYDQCVTIISNVIKNQRGDTVLTEISDNSKLKEDLHLDSLLLVVLQVEIEDAFKLRFDTYEDDFDKIFESVGTVCAYVEKQIGCTYEN